MSHTCISIDDDPLFTRKLEAFVEEIEGLELIDTFNNPIQGATAVIKQNPDILFLDMEMPHTGGGYLMDWLDPKLQTMEKQPKVIIITSLDKEKTESLPNVSGYINKFTLNSEEVLEKEVNRVLGI